MLFEKEALFKELVSKCGMNLYLGAGFSVYAYNDAGESLPLGDEINRQLIDLFSLDKSRNFELSKTCTKIKKDNEAALNRILKDKYTVKSYDPEYKKIVDLPIRNVVTLNIDDLLEKVYENSESKKRLVDSRIYGSLENLNSVHIYKIHGSVSYPMECRMSFTDKELTDLFLREKQLFETVSYKLSTAPTIFWGTSLKDGNTLELLCNSEAFAKQKTQKWIVVYPSPENKDYIEDFQEQGFNIIEADTKELIEYLFSMGIINKADIAKCYKYGDIFPKNYITDKLKKISVRRPVVDFFSGAEPQISDILSNNVIRISYFSEIVNRIITEKIVLITGIPGCGKSTLLLQIAFSDEISGNKLWFNNITKEEALRLKKLIENNNDFNSKVTVFIDNLYSNMDAFNILKDVKAVKLVVAERALNFDYIKRSFNINTNQIVDVSNLNNEDIQNICKSMNRPSADAIKLISKNENISLLEIVFYVTTNTMITSRIKRYIDDLRGFEDERLNINLLELFTLVNYTSYCGVPISMDMLMFYFNDEMESYEDIIYALDKMNQIIVETNDIEDDYTDQDYLVMRSKLFAEKTLACVDKITMGKVLNQFWDKINPQIIYRYDVLRKKAYDADIIAKTFSFKEGCNFYEKMLTINGSPFVKHQYAIFLQRKKKYDLAWNMIDQAYTESERKVFTIANTHAVILFEMNIEAEANNEDEYKLLKETLHKSFNTLGYCITQDVRINYHVLVYSRNTIRYYEKFGEDGYTEEYVESSLRQLNAILDSGEYMYSGMKRQLQDNRRSLIEINKRIQE